MSVENNHDKKEYIRQKMLEKQGEARIVRRIVFIVSIILFLGVGASVAGGYYYIQSALKPVDPTNTKDKKVEVPIGSSVTGIANILEKNGIIKDARVFKYYVKLKNEAGFMAGEYAFNPAMTLPEIIKSLKTGKIITEEVVFKITVPEGKQLGQIAAIISKHTKENEKQVFEKLNDKEFIDKFMKKYPNLLTDEILAENIKYPLEGYLFPATYSFYKEDPTLEEIVNEMIKKTSKVVEQYTGQMEEWEYTPHQLLTMASLIEEEATEKLERDQIASVFYNRMEIGMPLQTDPTVLYAKGEHAAKVYKKDLQIDDPYNTYQNVGLTPGPIANAGTVSIEAALIPAETDYLYFLATASGEVLFSKTLEEHNIKKAQHIK
ncbi:endolytic transglycosylase MltG (plasmid) [Bacillus sp. 31A1R]|uniref:Endolytic murein transglycosylase n=1 Tax=Robertmurraya mangrovi TaxID=3098077 RepID=A0ABU5IUQ4_9BACI|nr:endolytic transglycosylase MltG [Bacillus sp. 31A1R]MDZ5470884.1 endolytic transglycosylase MltG [Bacillus sp. 31A1R]